MTIERRTITSRDEWLEWRKQDVTGSVVGALFCPHPYTTALRLYAEKRGVKFPDVDETKAMRRGRWMEPAVARAVSEARPEWRLEAPNVYLRDPILKLGATPDFFVHGDPRGLGVLQCKSVDPRVYKRDWDNGETVPLWITLQCAAEVMLADAAFGAVAALPIDPNMDLALHEFDRNPGVEHKIRIGVKTFWADVEAGVEPEPDYAADAATIAALSPPLPKELRGGQIDLSGNNELPGLLEERAAINEAMGEAEDRRDAIDAEIKWMMGDAEEAIGVDGWRITYKTIDREGYQVAPKTIRSLRVYDKREKPHE